jgi:hypothetical protein
MRKTKKPPVPAGSGALPVSKDPRIWATAAVRLAKAIGVEAFVGVVSLVVFSRWGMTSEHMVVYGLALIWSLFAIDRMRR